MISANKDIKYVKGNYNNLYLATKIQVEIFKDNCALLEFLQCLLKVNNHTDFYLIYQKGELAGFVSFYDGHVMAQKTKFGLGILVFCLNLGTIILQVRLY